MPSDNMPSDYGSLDLTDNDDLERRVAEALDKPCGHEGNWFARFTFRNCPECRNKVIAAALRTTAKTPGHSATCECPNCQTYHDRVAAGLAELGGKPNGKSG